MSIGRIVPTFRDISFFKRVMGSDRFTHIQIFPLNPRERRSSVFALVSQYPAVDSCGRSMPNAAGWHSPHQPAADTTVLWSPLAYLAVGVEPRVEDIITLGRRQPIAAKHGGKYQRERVVGGYTDHESDRSPIHRSLIVSLCSST